MKGKPRECECQVCGHRWKPRVDKPRECPHCKRYDWRKE